MADQACRQIADSHARLRQWSEVDIPMYGVNTGFGMLAHVVVPSRHGAELQANLLRSHAAGAGPAFSDEVARAMMVTRLNCLARGYAGVGLAHARAPIGAGWSPLGRPRRDRPATARSGCGSGSTDACMPGQRPVHRRRRYEPLRDGLRWGCAWTTTRAE